VNQSLETYFDQGFVYNLDQKLPEWVKMGWIPEYRKKDSLSDGKQSGIFSKMIYEKIIEDLSKYTRGQVVADSKDLRNRDAYRWISEARNKMSKVKKPLCSAIFF
jgi:hypothetical protein